MEKEIDYLRLLGGICDALDEMNERGGVNPSNEIKAGLLSILVGAMPDQT
jgi:hypothetical protein